MGALRRDDDSRADASPSPSTVAGCSITRAPRHEQQAGYEALPRDLVAGLLLGWGIANSYPSLPLKLGESIPTGEMGWAAFVSRAPFGLLKLALERVRAASSRRCVILGCRSTCADDDVVYCLEHRERADDGRLWAASAQTETTQEAQNGRQRAVQATETRFWTPAHLRLERLS